MEVLSGEPLVEVRRGELVESVHSVAACVSDDAGGVQFALGDIERPVFLRSSVKPFIAAAIVRAGVADRFALSDAELAVISASHTGEPDHVAAVRRILQKSGVPESALQCGAHAPYDAAAARMLADRGEAPSAVHSNCSGKHAGILALARVLGAPLDGYLDPRHPAQAQILAFCARQFGTQPGELPLAVDGCGIPTMAIPLRRAAMAFARFATLRRLEEADRVALARVKIALQREPWYLSGSGRFDTALIEATGGSIVGKGGAEGVHADALSAPGLGLALKVIDGAARAVAPTVCALCHTVGAVDAAALARLAPFYRTVLYNVAGREVGTISADLPPSRAAVRSGLRAT